MAPKNIIIKKRKGPPKGTITRGNIPVAHRYLDIPMGHKKSDIELPVTFIVLTHDAYIKNGYLDGCMDSVDIQMYPFAQKVVILNQCTEKVEEKEGWEYVRVEKWPFGVGHQYARSEGMKAVKMPWVLPFDADNKLPPDYTIALFGEFGMLQELDRRVAFIYTDMQLINENDAPGMYVEHPEHDLARLEFRNYADTASIWRTEAVMDTGGWIQKRVFEDWEMALRLSHLGYSGKKLKGTALLYRKHSGGQYTDDSSLVVETAWAGKTYAIVTLLSGREEELEWRDLWWRYAALPDQTSLYVVDNSASSPFHEKVNAILRQPEVYTRFKSVTYLKVDKQLDSPSEFDIHRHVAYLYNQVVPGLPHDFVLLMEDDVHPPLSATRDLVEQMTKSPRAGIVGGGVPNRDGPAHSITSGGRDNWSNMLPYRRTRDRICQVGMIGGGFTLYRNSLLQKSVPFRAWMRFERMDGWDSVVSRDIRQMGYRVYLHGMVDCVHRGRVFLKPEDEE